LSGLLGNNLTARADEKLIIEEDKKYKKIKFEDCDF
jgi:hypothetical protein